MADRKLKVEFTVTMTQYITWDSDVPMTEENLLCNLEVSNAEDNNDHEITNVEHKGEHVEFE